VHNAEVWGDYAATGVVLVRDIHALLDPHVVFWPELSGQDIARSRDETMMHVGPKVRLLQIGIHSWKWGGHGISSQLVTNPHNGLFSHLSGLYRSTHQNDRYAGNALGLG